MDDDQFNDIRKKVEEAVLALRLYASKWSEKHTKKKQLLEDDRSLQLFLQLCLKKIPQHHGIKVLKVHLPHSTHFDTNDVCLITGDLDRHDRRAEIEPTVRHYRELLEEHHVKEITEIVPLRQLRTDYKPFEARKKLCRGFDKFLADRRIIGYLPSLLGQEFWRKRKFPQAIDLHSSNLKNEVEKCLATSLLHVTGRGSSCTVDVGHLGLSDADLSDNIGKAVQIIAERIPGKWQNVHSLHVKLARSLALPIYVSLASINDVTLREKRKRDKPVTGELTTLPNSMVRVFPSGTVHVIPNKKVKRVKDNHDDHEEIVFQEEVKEKTECQKKKQKKTALLNNIKKAKRLTYKKKGRWSGTKSKTTA